MRRFSKQRRYERGMTIIEALVAVLVFSIVFITALTLYQAANRAYLRTDAATIQQQNVRFAMDRMSETLRDAGAAYNMTGVKTMADEQIEGAWESAIFVRGDFDNSRETALQNATYPVVSTGNDEVVGYVLRKAGANSYNITVKFDTTTTGGRDAAIDTATNSVTNEETVTIPVAARTLAEETDPPYELTRVSFDSTGAPVYEVVSENVFRLSFTYQNATGTAVIAAGSNDGAADAQRTNRSTVRRIGVSLTGMADRPDFGYTDTHTYTPAESATTKNRRKFTLAENILAINLGMTGKRHYDTPELDPDTPGYLTVCTGHCRNFLLQWGASASTAVTRYRIHYSAPASGVVPSLDETVEIEGTQLQFEEPVADRDAGITRAYTFQVAPVSSAGVGTYTSTVTATMQEVTGSSGAWISKPRIPQDVAASQPTGLNVIQVNWTPVAENEGTITDATCSSVGSVTGTSAPPDPWASSAVDISTYKIYRLRDDGGVNGNFTPASANDVSSQAIGELTNVPPDNYFTDNTAAPCTRYYYRVKSCDICNNESTDPSDAMGTSFGFDLAAGVVPAAPGTPFNFSPVSTAGGNYTLQLTWPAVTRTTGGARAAVSHYIIERWRKLEGEGSFTYQTSTDVYDSLISPQDVVPMQVSGVDAYYRYYVKAQYDCGDFGSGNRTSAASDPYDLVCTPDPSNTISITSPPEGANFSRPVEYVNPVSLTTTGTGWTGASVLIVDASGTIVYSQSITGAPAANVYTFPSWNNITAVDGVYTVTASGSNGGCRGSAASHQATLATNTCGLQIVNPTLSNSNRTLTFKVQNTCDNAGITINALTTGWTGASNGTVLKTIDYGNTHLAQNVSAASGTRVNFGSNVSIAANSTTTNSFSLIFNNALVSGANHTTFTSLLGQVITTPTTSTDEILNGNITP